MAAIRLKAGATFQGETLYAFTRDMLPAYAAPRFVRIQVSGPGFTRALGWGGWDFRASACVPPPPQFPMTTVPGSSCCPQHRPSVSGDGHPMSMTSSGPPRADDGIGQPFP